MTHGWEGEECLCSEQVPTGRAPGGLGWPPGSRIYHWAPSTAYPQPGRRFHPLPGRPRYRRPCPRGVPQCFPQRVQRVKVKTPTGYINATRHLARPTGAPRPSEGEASAAQHWASVAFISSSKLPSSAASLHFPSTETDFSPFFTRRQTWWPWMERLYMEAQESTLSTTEK